MKTTLIVCAMLLVAMLYPTEGFIPNKLLMVGSKILSGSSEDAVTHEDMTRNAHLEVAAEVLRDNPNPSDRLGSSRRLSALSSPDEEGLITAYYGHDDNDIRTNVFENAVESVQNANSDTDFNSDEKDLAAAHFDSEQLESGQNRLIQLQQSVVSSILAGNYDVAKRDTGRMFHTLQDFYSHTNWIENGNRSPYRVLGRPNQRIANIVSPTQQTCTDCVRKGFIINYYECQDNIVKSLIQNKMLTSGYADGQEDNEGNVIQKPRGKCSHGGFIDSSRETSATGGINKDGPYFRTSPHYYLYAEALAVAQQATTDMFRDIRTAVNNDQLFGAYLGIFSNQACTAIVESSAPIGSQAYLREKIRNILLEHHMNRINGKKHHLLKESF